MKCCGRPVGAGFWFAVVAIIRMKERREWARHLGHGRDSMLARGALSMRDEAEVAWLHYIFESARSGKPEKQLGLHG